jgi:hypothetical protein
MHNNISSITIEPTDSEAIEQMELFRRNAEWLSQNWHLVGDDCRGKMIAASEGEIFVADDRQTVQRLAKAKHPNDEPYVAYIPIAQYQRIYGNRVVVAAKDEDAR